MQTSEESLTKVLITGTVVIVLLIVFLFFFVILYQRRMIRNQIELQKLEAKKQTDLLHAVFNTQEVERKRLSEDLHDSVGQVLATIKMNLHRLSRIHSEEETGKFKILLQDTRQLTDECIQEIRNIINNVLPPLLTDFGLQEALDVLSKKIEATTAIRVDYSGNIAMERYTPEIEGALYRVVQELFSNAIKHAEATEIRLSLSKKDGMLFLEFHDNGKGFDQELVVKGSGLKNLRSRILFINGQIEIISKTNRGTLTHIWVKIP